MLHDVSLPWHYFAKCFASRWVGKFLKRANILERFWFNWLTNYALYSAYGTWPLSVLNSYKSTTISRSLFPQAPMWILSCVLGVCTLTSLSHASASPEQVFELKSEPGILRSPEIVGLAARIEKTEEAKELQKIAHKIARNTKDIYPDAKELDLDPLERLRRFSILALKHNVTNCQWDIAEEWNAWQEAKFEPIANDTRSVPEKLAVYVLNRVQEVIPSDPEILKFEAMFNSVYQQSQICWMTKDEENDALNMAYDLQTESHEFRKAHRNDYPNPNVSELEALDRFLKIAILALKWNATRLQIETVHSWKAWWYSFNKEIAFDTRNLFERFAAYVLDRIAGKIPDTAKILLFEQRLDATYKSTYTYLLTQPLFVEIGGAREAAMKAQKFVDQLVEQKVDEYPYINHSVLTPLDRLYRLAVLAVKPSVTWEQLLLVDKWHTWYLKLSPPLPYDTRTLAQRLLVYATNRRSSVIEGTPEIRAFEEEFDSEYRQSDDYTGAQFDTLPQHLPRYGEVNDTKQGMGDQKELERLQNLAYWNRLLHRNHYPNVYQAGISSLERIYRLSVLTLKSDATPAQYAILKHWYKTWGQEHEETAFDTRNSAEIFIHYTKARLEGEIPESPQILQTESDLDEMYQSTQEYIDAQGDEHLKSVARILKQEAEKGKAAAAKLYPDLDAPNLPPLERLDRLSVLAVKPNATVEQLEWAEIWRRWWRTMHTPIPYDTRTAAEELLEYTAKRQYGAIKDSPEIIQFEEKFSREYQQEHKFFVE